MEYSTYLEYETFTSEWLDQCPKGWKNVAVKHCYDIQLGKMLQNKPESSEDIEIDYLKALHVNWDKVTVDNLPLMWASKNDINKYSVKNGDLLICEGGEVGRSTILNGLKDKTIIQNALHRVRNDQLGEITYLNYTLRHLAKIGWFEILCNKATIAHLTGEKLGSIKMSLPPIKEQQKIANFLDYKTQQIDQLIAKKKALIEKLNEQRIAVITQAVTKGIDKNVKLKPSGVDWLGDVPEHWDVLRAKFVSSIFVPQRNKPKLNRSEGIFWATMDDMKDDFIKATKQYVEKEDAEISGSKVLKAGAVIASCVGNLGISSINNVDVIINQQLQAFIPHSINKKFLKEVVSISKNYFEQVGTAATLTYVNQLGFESMPVPFPPREEQKEIVDFIAVKVKKIDKMVSLSQKTIEYYQEYRTALITSAVTGKIDIRNIEISYQKEVA